MGFNFSIGDVSSGFRGLVRVPVAEKLSALRVNMVYSIIRIPKEVGVLATLLQVGFRVSGFGS